jgi:serine phosphatase RsbU (regulator of sigma subunit)
MPAAMTVALLVGAFRTLAEYTTSPREILAAMNRTALGRSHDGFTTCLVLRAQPDGALTIANAGHLPPYLDGEELALESGFPLGIQANPAYEESGFQLKPGAQLSLLTDGVVEARSATGELFGFARAQSWSRKSAEEILEAARAFGQEDDITVVTLVLAGAAPPVQVH